ncbi:unnamed protein product [Pseudo-nitzschia multistriata]|uniref:Secreted protein n=1 Tax=Pseudo-nitzschia multistriata TaxID=183589 RepID=A0A448YY02_9STRA|nr:unnamed protein product [Pseudo-nitzschia multistriata]
MGPAMSNIVNIALLSAALALVQGDAVVPVATDNENGCFAVCSKQFLLCFVGFQFESSAVEPAEKVCKETPIVRCVGELALPVDPGKHHVRQLGRIETTGGGREEFFAFRQGFPTVNLPGIFSRESVKVVVHRVLQCGREQYGASIRAGRFLGQHLEAYRPAHAVPEQVQRDFCLACFSESHGFDKRKRIIHGLLRLRKGLAVEIFDVLSVQREFHDADPGFR